MSSIDIDTIPGIQSLDDLAAEKYSGGSSSSIAISAKNGGISASIDGDLNLNITIIAPADGSEINLGDINLSAGGDININITEVQTADAAA